MQDSWNAYLKSLSPALKDLRGGTPEVMTIAVPTTTRTAVRHPPSHASANGVTADATGSMKTSSSARAPNSTTPAIAAGSRPNIIVPTWWRQKPKPVQSEPKPPASSRAAPPMARGGDDVVTGPG